MTIENKTASNGMKCILASVGTLALLLTCGCMGGGEVGPSGTNVGGVGAAGKVIQGPVSGATVFADRITIGGLGNMTMDADEAATKTTTDANGNYTLPVAPGYPYVIVSNGGVDTLSKQPAGIMLAPSGSRNVSSLTTMVALDTTGTVKAKINALGGAYDDNYSASGTPALLFFAKSIDTVVTAMVASLNPDGNTLSGAQSLDVQLKTMAALAVELAKPATTVTTLSTPAQLQTLATTAVTSAATTLDSLYTNISITNPASLAADVSATVPAIAAAVSPTGSASASLSVDPLTATPEAVALPPADLNAISRSVNTATVNSSDIVSVAPTPTTIPDTTPPTIIGNFMGYPNPMPVLASFTFEFSEALDLSTLTNTNFTVTGTTGTVTWDSGVFQATYTPSTILPANTSVTVSVSGVKDLAGNTMSPRTWPIFTAAAPDTIQPTVVSQTPAPGAIGIDYSTVTVVFSEAVDNINNTSFELFDNTTGLTVPGIFDYNFATNTLKFTADSKLNRATLYTVRMFGGIRDTSGNSLMNAPLSWSFTTTTTGSSSTVSNF